MAVKKHELVSDSRSQPDLEALITYIQVLNDQPSYVPPPQEIIRHSINIIRSLARTDGTEEQTWELVTVSEEFLVRIASTVHREFRHELVSTILEKFYAFTSDPQSDAGGAMSIVLVSLDASDPNAHLSAARWLVQKGDNGPAGEGLRASLSCFYRWVYEWQGTHCLGDWVLAFIKALEETERFDILIEVSVDNLGTLFRAMDRPLDKTQNVTDVICHVLASLRESTEALDRIAPHVGRVLMNLAADSGQWSRQLLQNVVDILTGMVDHLVHSFKGEAQDMFKDKYADVIRCLEQHMASRACAYLQLTPWRAQTVALPATVSHAPTTKVGLMNLGNTCYMNSVVQALLVTRTFSTHVMLKMSKTPYWSKMGSLFALMMHSVSTKLNPTDFFKAVKPPFFTNENQHDSSEFLGYLFELLQSYEHIIDENYDYTRPPVLTGVNRARVMQPNQQVACASNCSSDNDNDPSGLRRSVSPRPGSSTAGASSSSSKRHFELPESQIPLKKRRMTPDPVYLRRESFIDNLFGGVLLTRVECVECHSSSLSRDVFRDLQLAFPDKPEGWQYTVQGLLEYYCSKESLSGDNRYACRDCGCLRDAERSVLIETTPKFLILVLKNFKFEPKLQMQTKLMHPVYHNTTVTLPTVRSQADHAKYVLYAAVIHAGTALDEGHYYTLGKDTDGWHIYNDEIVCASDQSELNNLKVGNTPYILFYRRTDVEETTAPTLEELPTSVQEQVAINDKLYVDSLQQMRRARP